MNKKPLTLSEHHKANFITLKRACENDDLGLISAIRKSDGQAVALVCAVQWDEETQKYLTVPLAEMIDGNPYELYYDPTEDL